MYSLFITLSLIILLLIFLNTTDSWLSLIYRIELWTDSKAIIMKHKKNKKAVLLIHEFSGSPESLRFLAEGIFQEGWDVIVPPMPGATKSIQVLEKNSPSLYHQWVELAWQEYKKLEGKYEILVLIGASLGGSIALDVCLKPECNSVAVVTLASPLRLKGKHYRRKLLRNSMLSWSGVLALFKKTSVTGRLRPAGRKLVPLEGVEGLVVLPSVHSHKIGVNRLRRRLSQLKIPLLSIHADSDSTVGSVSQDILCERVSSSWLVRKRLNLKEDMTRHHYIWSHKHCKEQVKDEVLSFLSRVIKR